MLFFANVSPLYCDKITATLNVSMKDEPIVVANIDSLFQIGHATYGRRDNYKNGRKLDVSGGEYPPSYLLVQYTPKNDKAAFLRFEFNPAKCDLHHLREYMNAIVPGGFSYFVAEADCTRVDAAVDISGFDINDLIFSHPGVQVTKTHSRSGRLETYYLGSPVSPRQFCVYDKRAEIERKNGSTPYKTPVPKHALTRIEARVKDLPFCALGNLPNPFASLELSHRSKLKDNDEFFRMFLEATRFQGGQKMLAQLSPKTRKKFRERLQVGKPIWWRPAPLWKEWPAVAKTILNPPLGAFSLSLPTVLDAMDGESSISSGLGGLH